MSLTSNLAKYVKKNKVGAAPSPAGEPDGDENMGSVTPGDAARAATPTVAKPKKKKIAMPSSGREGGGRLSTKGIYT